MSAPRDAAGWAELAKGALIWIWAVVKKLAWTAVCFVAFCIRLLLVIVAIFLPIDIMSNRRR